MVPATSQDSGFMRVFVIQELVSHHFLMNPRRFRGLSNLYNCASNTLENGFGKVAPGVCFICPLRAQSNPHPCLLVLWFDPTPYFDLPKQENRVGKTDLFLERCQIFSRTKLKNTL